jgi:hypothetical protein
MMAGRVAISRKAQRILNVNSHENGQLEKLKTESFEGGKALSIQK